MPTTHVPPQSSGPPSLKVPICPACHGEMRLRNIEPHDRYQNLDTWTFECSCGETTSWAIARE